jgi:hypothetical protein
MSTNAQLVMLRTMLTVCLTFLLGTIDRRVAKLKQAGALIKEALAA